MKNIKDLDKTLVDMGAHICEARQAKHLSLRDLADMTGSSYSGLCRLEAGKEPDPGMKRIHKICSALEIEIRDIM